MKINEKLICILKLLGIVFIFVSIITHLYAGVLNGYQFSKGIGERNFIFSFFFLQFVINQLKGLISATLIGTSIIGAAQILHTLKN